MSCYHCHCRASSGDRSGNGVCSSALLQQLFTRLSPLMASGPCDRGAESRLCGMPRAADDGT